MAVAVCAAVEVVLGMATGWAAARAWWTGDADVHASLAVTGAMGAVSFALGMGLFAFSPLARRWMVLFSVLVLVNHALGAAGVTLWSSPELVAVPAPARLGVSLAYHLMVIVLLSLPQAARVFAPDSAGGRA